MYSYGKIYTASFKSAHSGHTYYIDIRKKDYTGSSTVIDNLADSPIIYKSVDNESNIKCSEVQFSFIVNKSQFSLFDEILEGDIFSYMLYIQHATGSMDAYTHWRGWIIPSESKRGYFDENTIYTISASDYLGKLKELTFSTGGSVQTITKERLRITNIIGRILLKLGEFGDDILIQSGIEETNMASEIGPGIHKIYMHPTNFTRSRNRLIVPENCHVVLDNILKVFNLKICSPFINMETLSAYWGGIQYFITDLNEASSLIYRSYNDGKGTLTYDAASDFTNINLINIDDYVFYPESELTKQFPINDIELIQHNYDNGVIIGSTNFNDMDNASIWTLSDATVTQSGEVNTFNIAALTTAEITTTNSYQLENSEGNAYIRISFRLTNKEQATVLPLFVKVNVINTTTNETKSDILPLIVQLQSYHFYSQPHSMYLIQHNCYYKFELSVTNASLFYDIDFELTNFGIAKYYVIDNQFTENVLWDYLFEAYKINNTEPAFTIETRLGDSDITSNKSALTYSSSDADLTSVWNRYGVSETKSIQEILLQNYFNRFGCDKTILKLKVFDPSDTISLINIIEFDGNTYEILDIEKDIKYGICSLRLAKISTSDVSIKILKKMVPNTSADGSSSSSVVTNNGTNIANNLNDAYALRNAKIVSITTGTTLDATYAGKIVECSGTFTVTLPNSMVTGMRVDIVNIGTGTITIAASTTLQSDSSKTKLATKYTGASCYHRGSNVWLVVGKLTS